mmetsp:Transcript_39436/g.67645  ORF Transcript_39436/g.67645 Transcript_39436/m.67645 type:complete len:239 (+) Transcript_39436:1877-2593(+)
MTEIVPVRDEVHVAVAAVERPHHGISIERVPWASDLVRTREDPSVRMLRLVGTARDRLVHDEGVLGENGAHDRRYDLGRDFQLHRALCHQGHGPDRGTGCGVEGVRPFQALRDRFGRDCRAVREDAAGLQRDLPYTLVGSILDRLSMSELGKQVSISVDLVQLLANAVAGERPPRALHGGRIVAACQERLSDLDGRQGVRFRDRLRGLPVRVRLVDDNVGEVKCLVELADVRRRELEG